MVYAEGKKEEMGLRFRFSADTLASSVEMEKKTRERLRKSDQEHGL